MKSMETFQFIYFLFITRYLSEIKIEVTDSSAGLKFQRISDCLCIMKLEHCWKIKRRLRSNICGVKKERK